MRVLIFLILSFHFTSVFSQDSLYTRKVLKILCSKDFYGRGYVRNGLGKAGDFLVSEIKQTSAQPLFGKNYTQSFFHQVNTFPKAVNITLNGKKLIPGDDFIPSAGDGSLKGTFTLNKLDSVTFYGEQTGQSVIVKLKDKLTYTVAKDVIPEFIIELDREKFKDTPQKIKINFKNKLVKDFESRNIACFFPGTFAKDTMIVFTAHYDHLGGLGKHTFFPGANDNASGVSMVLNLLIYYQAHPPKYKTVFIFFAGEEAGLLGSKFFVESAALDLKKIKFLINLDLLGTGDDGIMVVNGAAYKNEFEKLSLLNSSNKLLPEIKKRGKAANSDHYWFSEQGVPCFFIYTMGGIKAYHDVYDVEKTLPLTKYKAVYELLLNFVKVL